MTMTAPCRRPAAPRRRPQAGDAAAPGRAAAVLWMRRGRGWQNRGRAGAVPAMPGAAALAAARCTERTMPMPANVTGTIVRVRIAPAQTLAALARALRDLDDVAAPRDVAHAAHRALCAAALHAADREPDGASNADAAAIAALCAVGAALILDAAPPVRQNLADALAALTARLGADDGETPPDAGAAVCAALDAAVAERNAAVVAATLLVAAAVNCASRR